MPLHLPRPDHGHAHRRAGAAGLDTRTVSPRPASKPCGRTTVPSLDWLDERGAQRIADLGEHDLRDYARNCPRRTRHPTTRGWYCSRSPASGSTRRTCDPRPTDPAVLGTRRRRDPRPQPVVTREQTRRSTRHHVRAAGVVLGRIWRTRLPSPLSTASARHHRPSAGRPSPAGSILRRRPTPAGPANCSSAASPIVTAYLTGMRADEVSSLRRGCCTPLHPVASPSRAAPSKSAVVNGRAVAEGLDREHPGGLRPSPTPSQTMENLHDSLLIFLPACSDAPDRPPVNDIPSTGVQRPRRFIEALIGWANTPRPSFGRDHGKPRGPRTEPSATPPAPNLAWFIYRRPAAGSPLGIQYGHLHAATTDGYGSNLGWDVTCSPWKKLWPGSDTPRPRGYRHARGQPTSARAASRYLGRRPSGTPPTTPGQPHGTTGSRDGLKPPPCASTTAPARSRLLLRPRQGPCASAGPRRPSPCPPGPDSLRRSAPPSRSTPTSTFPPSCGSSDCTTRSRRPDDTWNRRLPPLLRANGTKPSSTPTRHVPMVITYQHGRPSATP